ncbi:MAG: efflux RND transporter periplasmic adaptor subunit [Lautropia sp.]|nr:efflux RND transporter periplasmic adaptor subunit [Lautropia sp.]
MKVVPIALFDGALRRSLSGGGLCLCVLALCTVSIACTEQKQSAESASQVVPVQVVTARMEAESVGGAFSGILIPRIDTPLSFRVPGRIVERRVNAGDTVNKGDVLARLDSTPFILAVKEAQADLAQARATRARAARDVRRNRQLVQAGAITGSSLDALETQYANVDAQVRAASSRLQRARNALTYTTLTATADGTVARVEAEEGQVVDQGAPILRLAHGGEYEIQVDVPENRIAAVVPAQRASVRLLSLPAVNLTGKVREVGSVADPVTRTYRIRVSLSDIPEAARLGMTASVQLHGSSGQQLRLPVSALFQAGDRPAVWILPEGAQQLVLRPVSLAAMGSEMMTISGGVSPGERVVTAGVHRLDAGMMVKVWDGQLP